MPKKKAKKKNKSRKKVKKNKIKKKVRKIAKLKTEKELIYKTKKEWISKAIVNKTQYEKKYNESIKNNAGCLSFLQKLAIYSDVSIPSDRE